MRRGDNGARKDYRLVFAASALLALPVGVACQDCGLSSKEASTCFVDFPCPYPYYCTSTGHQPVATNCDCHSACGPGPCSGCYCEPVGPEVACPAGTRCVDRANDISQACQPVDARADSGAPGFTDAGVADASPANRDIGFAPDAASPRDEAAPPDIPADSGAGIAAEAQPVMPTAWTRLLGTTGYDFGNDVAVDPNGNVYVTGSVPEQLDDNPHAGSSDVFVAKYDGNGTKLWTRELGTPLADDARSVATDGAGNVVIAGRVAGNLDGNAYAGATDVFVAKYDGSGAKLWVRELGTSSFEQANTVTTDQAGNIYVAGVTQGGLGGNVSAGDGDVFLVKLDANGAEQWTRQFGSAAFEVAMGVATDAAGNVRVAGYTRGALEGSTSAGMEDLFVAKYDGNGGKLWLRQLGTSADDEALGVAVDGAGNVYAVGQTDGGLDGNASSGGTDAVVVKYDTNGDKQWTRQLGSAVATDAARAVAASATGEAYVAGHTYGDLDGWIGAGDTDVFVAKYDGSGTKQWTLQKGTSGYDHAYAAAVDPAGNLYLAGTTEGPLDGNVNLGQQDAFVMKLTPP
jgi:hypothetical protein